LSAGIAIVAKFTIAFNRVSAESGIRITRAGKVALCRDRVTNSITAKINSEIQLVREIESIIVRNRHGELTGRSSRFDGSLAAYAGIRNVSGVGDNGTGAPLPLALQVLSTAGDEVVTRDDNYFLRKNNSVRERGKQRNNNVKQLETRLRSRAIRCRREGNESLAGG